MKKVKRFFETLLLAVTNIVVYLTVIILCYNTDIEMMMLNCLLLLASALFWGSLPAHGYFD